MKRILFILALLLVITSTASAQTADRNLYLNNDATYGRLGLTAADTISNFDQIYIVQITGKHNQRALQKINVKLETASGSPEVSVQLQGFTFSGQTPVNIGDAVVWKGTSADTTIIISNTAVNGYRFYWVYMDATAVAQNSLITIFEGKLFLE